MFTQVLSFWVWTDGNAVVAAGWWVAGWIGTVDVCTAAFNFRITRPPNTDYLCKMQHHTDTCSDESLNDTE